MRIGYARYGGCRSLLGLHRRGYGRVRIASPSPSARTWSSAELPSGGVGIDAGPSIDLDDIGADTVECRSFLGRSQRGHSRGPIAFPDDLGQTPSLNDVARTGPSLQLPPSSPQQPSHPSIANATRVALCRTAQHRHSCIKRAQDTFWRTFIHPFRTVR